MEGKLVSVTFNEDVSFKLTKHTSFGPINMFCNVSAGKYYVHTLLSNLSEQLKVDFSIFDIKYCRASSPRNFSLVHGEYNGWSILGFALPDSSVGRSDSVFVGEPTERYELISYLPIGFNEEGNKTTFKSKEELIIWGKRNPDVMLRVEDLLEIIDWSVEKERGREEITICLTI